MTGPASAGSDRPFADRTAVPLEVVVVAYRAPELLDACLAELGAAYPVTVVDNSSDPVVRAVAARHAATYVDPGSNLGFGAGVNAALANGHDPGADVLLLNPDAAIRPSGVAALQHTLRSRPDLCAVAPLQAEPGTGAPLQVGWPFPTPFGAWIDAAGLGRLRRHDGFLVGSVLMLRAEALTEVGGFDETFFLYAEETDWQRRARDLGWQVAHCPDAIASHVGAGTGGDEAERETHFHASHERYIRKHHGRAGWAVYRAAQIAGAAVRALVLPGGRGRRAALRFRLYWTGPCRAEGGLDAADPTRPSMVHVVLTDGFAGVERHVCAVANGMADRGHRVAVLGGDPVRMRAELDSSITHRAARSLQKGAWWLATAGPVDLVHVHMTAAEGAAFLARPFLGAPVVATRHFAQRRGSNPVARALAALAARPITADLAISEFVAEAIGAPSILVRNGVPDRPQADLGHGVVVMLQRLDAEKSPDVGLRAWAASGLAEDGWRLVVAGSGVLHSAMEALARELGVAASVEFAGRVDDTDALLAGAAILLAPAAAEPFGLSVVEAMSHGVPVVAAAGGAHFETVGRDGRLFDPGDAAGAGAALAELAGSAPLRKDVGARLRERQQREFSLGRQLDELEAVYQRVVDESRGA